jgi:hypothetical protein
MHLIKHLQTKQEKMSMSLKEKWILVTCILTDTLEMLGKSMMVVLVTRLPATTLINVSPFLTSVNPHL